MFTEAADSYFLHNVHQQPTQSHIGLSPGVLAAIGCVQQALRKVQVGLSTPKATSLQDLAQGLANQGLLVTLRSGLGVGMDSPDYLSTLRHSFLICQEGSSRLCIIVDPSFREQFKVAGIPVGSSYSSAVSHVPDCFVGTIGTVNALVCLLTGTLLQESTALGLELPPWRSKQALLSNWLPRRFEDEVFTPPSLAGLHPVLRSSVHDTLSCSPSSIQSWPSLRKSDSRLDASDCSSQAHSARSSNSPSDFASSRPSSPAPTQPHTVVKGFLPTTTTTRRDSCSPATTTSRSALTQQLAAASEASQQVHLAAQDLWARCLGERLACEPQHQQLRPLPDVAQSLGAGLEEPEGLELQESLQQSSGLCGDSLPEDCPMVLSPARKRCGASGGSSLRRGTCCAASSLKLPATMLKVLPRIYTVKLATAAVC